MPSAPLLEQARAMAAGLRGTAAVWPRRLEVWAALVDGRGDGEGGGDEGGGGGGEGGGGSEGGGGGKQALDELLNVRPSLHGFSMEPLRAHLQALSPTPPLTATLTLTRTLTLTLTLTHPPGGAASPAPRRSALARRPARAAQG